MQSLRGGGGIIETVRRTRYALPDELYSTGYKRLTHALSNGTTTVEVKTGYGLDMSGEAKMLRVINRLRKFHQSNVIGTFLGAHAVPPESPTTDDYTRFLLGDLLPMARNIGGAVFCDVFCETGGFTPEQAVLVFRGGVKVGFKPKIHADQFTGRGGAKNANQDGAVFSDHLVQSPISHRELLAETS